MDLNINTINDWDKWKKTLYNAVSMGETVGLSDDTITNLGTKVGEFLASNVDPENPQQRLLKELFDASNKREQETLTNVIIKMVEKEH
jgi:hypothetical protein